MSANDLSDSVVHRKIRFYEFYYTLFCFQIRKVVFVSFLYGTRIKLNNYNEKKN